MSTDVVLVAMPWAALTMPSAQLGVLAGSLRASGHRVRTFSLYLAFMDHLMRAGTGLSTSAYDDIAYRRGTIGAGEWVFAVPPYATPTAAGDADYLAWITAEGGVDGAAVERLRVMRGLVPSFLEQAADEVLAQAPRVVGFTTTFSQNVPSLALASTIKRRADVAIVFGGANCFGEMGRGLVRAFPWIDAAVDGEGEGVLQRIVDDVLAGRPIRRRPGVALPGAGERSDDPDPITAPAMDELAVPEYDEYFERLERTAFAPDIDAQVALPLETARGCWWGEKHHCTFCGLNGTSMRFRSKSPARAVAEVRALARRHRRLSFKAVDNIMDLDYIATALAELADSGLDLDLFYETKANLTEAQLLAMKRAGIRSIQPGIESLDTEALRLMRKGTTALQNLRLLKWCAQHDIDVGWNILYGFSGESSASFERMAALIPALGHLTPPYLVQAQAQRFAPMFEAPAAHGVEILEPFPYVNHIYPHLGPAERRGISFSFGHRFLDGWEPARHVAPLQAAVSAWREHAAADYQRLRHRLGRDMVLIEDRRHTAGPTGNRVCLHGPRARAYLACDAGATVDAVRVACGPGLAAAELVHLLERLCEERLMVKVDGRYLTVGLRNRHWEEPS
jgi:ribosomal peptide maturation radical SAM protein 1